MKICIVSSCGGHLTEVRCLRPAYDRYQHFYVLNDQAILPPDMRGRTFFISHAERNWLMLYNFWEAYRILRREKPTVIISTGAGPVVPFAIVGKLFFRIHVIFIETITRIRRPSLTGRIMYHIADDFYYQWEPLQKFFPKAKYAGTVL